MEPYTGFDYNLILCPLQSRLQYIYHGQPYARVNLNPSQVLWIWPQYSTYKLWSMFLVENKQWTLTCEPCCFGYEESSSVQVSLGETGLTAWLKTSVTKDVMNVLWNEYDAWLQK